MREFETMKIMLKIDKFIYCHWDYRAWSTQWITHIGYWDIIQFITIIIA